MTKIHKVVVIGATGLLGKPVTYELIKAGFAVTVLARDIQKAKLLFPHASIIQGNLQDKTSLIRAFTGQDAVYCNLNLPQTSKPSDWHAEKQGVDTILEAAKQTGIASIGFISSIIMDHQGKNGFTWWVFEVKQQAVNKIKQSGIPYLIFYPSTFMDNFLSTYKVGKRILLAGKSIAPMYYIAGEDFGKQVARAFQLYPTNNKEYFIQGPEAYTADQAAKIFIANYTKEKLTITTAPLGLLKFMGKFIQQVEYGARIIEALNTYPEKFRSEQTWEELGKPTITLKEFAQKHS